MQSWRRNWEAVISLFAFPNKARKIIYTTNATESLNASVRKAVRNKDHFPSDQAATKLIWLALRPHHRELEEAADLMACCQGPTGYPVRRSFRVERVNLSSGSCTKFLTLPAISVATSAATGLYTWKACVVPRPNLACTF